MKRLLESNRIRRRLVPVVAGIRHSPTLMTMANKIRTALGGRRPAWTMGREVEDLRYKVNFKDLLSDVGGLKIGLIISETDPVVQPFLKAAEALGMVGAIYDPVTDNFHDRVMNAPEQIFLCRPLHWTNQQRQMYWEKTFPLFDLPDLTIQPGKRALSFYESKRELAYFLKLHSIPHPKTHVFYDKAEALEFAQHCSLPQVFKTNTGSASTGVEIIRTRSALLRMVHEVFDRRYVKRSMSDTRDFDYGHIIFQEFISPVREFRIIRIGKSWFGHEKKPGVDSELMSGSGESAWTPPPSDLLDFCEALSDRLDLPVMCFDIFQSGQGPYLVNELQTWFGSYDNSQMYIDDVPGRYVREAGQWVFQPGFFNEYCSMALIIMAAVEKHRSVGQDVISRKR